MVLIPPQIKLSKLVYEIENLTIHETRLLPKSKNVNSYKSISRPQLNYTITYTKTTIHSNN